MKKTLLMKRLLFLSILLSFTLPGISQILMTEDFDYTVGDQALVHTWLIQGTAVTNPILITSNNLTHVNYPMGNGNSINLVDNGQDIFKGFTQQTSGSIYMSFLVKVTSAGTGDYFISLKESPTSTSNTNYRGRIFVKKDGSDATKINFGIAKAAAAGNYSSTQYDLNTAYLLVLKYTIVDGTTNDQVSLFIEPSISTTEPTTPSVTATDVTATDYNIGSVLVRQGTALQASALIIDGIRVTNNWTDAVLDVYAPAETFIPINSATDVLTSVTPTISFDEPVFKSDGTTITDADLPSLLTFKQTDASGTDVPFTATISANKKLITLTPTPALSNSQVYYLGIGAIKDASGNQTAASSVTFTTIAAATPSVTLTSPAGGETVIAGDPFTFTWTSKNITKVNLEAYVVDNTLRTSSWVSIVTDIDASTGKYDYVIPADATYGTDYKIRVSDASNATVNSTSGSFTLYSNATSISELRSRCIVNDIVRLSSEATITFIRTNRNQKYIQDTGSGLLVDDPTLLISTTLHNGDNIKGLIGKLSLYSGVMQITPVASTITVTSTGNIPTIPEMTLAEYKANYQTYESRLIKLSNIYFASANGTIVFDPATNYTDLTDGIDGTTTVTLRTFNSGEGDIIGTTIPVAHRRLTCIAGNFNGTVQVYVRYLADFDFLEAAELTTMEKPVIYPIPAKDVLRIRNISNVSHADILDASGRVIRSTNVTGDEEVAIPVSDLKKGMYFLRLTTATGKVTTKFIK